MIAVKPTQMRDNFKNLCVRVISGETIIVSRPNNENVVVLSEEEYNALIKAARNIAYLKKLEKGFQDIANEKGKVFSIEELSGMASE